MLGLLFAILWVACAILFDNHGHSFVVAFFGGTVTALTVSIIVCAGIPA